MQGIDRESLLQIEPSAASLMFLALQDEDPCTMALFHLGDPALYLPVVA